MSLETTYSTTVPVGGAESYKLWPVFTYSNGYWEVYRHLMGDFLGLGVGCWDKLKGGGGCMLEDLSIDKFVVGVENFNQGAYDFLVLFEKQWKNKYEKFFSIENKEQH